MSAALQSLIRDEKRSGEAGSVILGLVAFALIGGGGALAFVVLSSAMISLGTGVADWVVNTGCYASLIVPVYLLHRRFTFQSDASHLQALPRYMAVQCSALALAALFSFLVHGVLTLPTVLASTVVIGLTSGINFVVLRSWAFARTRVAAMGDATA